jgi:hypothetical protein
MRSEVQFARWSCLHIVEHDARELRDEVTLERATQLWRSLPVPPREDLIQHRDCHMFDFARTSGGTVSRSCEDTQEVLGDDGDLAVIDAMIIFEYTGVCDKTIYTCLLNAAHTQYPRHQLKISSNGITITSCEDKSCARVLFT